MIEDVPAHVKETGREVEQADDPRALIIGYMDPPTGKVWQIRLSHMKKLMSSRDPRAPAFIECIKTASGRLQLANLPLLKL